MYVYTLLQFDFISKNRAMQSEIHATHSSHSDHRPIRLQVPSNTNRKNRLQISKQKNYVNRMKYIKIEHSRKKSLKLIRFISIWWLMFFNSTVIYTQLRKCSVDLSNLFQNHFDSIGNTAFGWLFLKENEEECSYKR